MVPNSTNSMFSVSSQGSVYSLAQSFSSNHHGSNSDQNSVHSHHNVEQLLDKINSTSDDAASFAGSSDMASLISSYTVSSQDSESLNESHPANNGSVEHKSDQESEQNPHLLHHQPDEMFAGEVSDDSSSAISSDSDLL